MFLVSGSRLHCLLEILIKMQTNNCNLFFEFSSNKTKDLRRGRNEF